MNRNKLCSCDSLGMNFFLNIYTRVRTSVFDIFDNNASINVKFSQNGLHMIGSIEIMLTVIGLDHILVIWTSDPEFAKNLYRPYAIILYLVIKICNWRDGRKKTKTQKQKGLQHQYIRSRMGDGTEMSYNIKVIY